MKRLRRRNLKGEELTKTNLAIAMSCQARPTTKKKTEEGAEATDWRKGLPIRVVS